MPKRNVVVGLLLAGLAAVSHPAAAGTLPATLAKALEGAELDAPDAWSFRETSLVSALGKKTVRAVTRWDMTKPEGERCTVESVEVLKGDPSSDKEEHPCQGGHERETYGELRQMLEEAVIEPVSENDAEAVYRITPSDTQHGLQMGGVNVNIGDDGAKDLVGTVHVTKTGAGAPYVDRVALHLQKPAGNLIASVGKLEITYTYAPDPASGAKLMRSLDVDVQVTLFVAVDITTTVSNRYDEYKRIK